MANMLEMLCYINTKEFMKTIIPILTNTSTFQQPLCPFVMGMHQVVANLTDDSSDTIELKNRLVKIVSDFIGIMKLDFENCVLIFNTNSFTSALSAAIDEREVALDRMCLTLTKTSFPDYDGVESSNSNNYIADSVKQFNVSKYFQPDKEESKMLPSSTQNTMVEIEEKIILLSLYLNPDN